MAAADDLVVGVEADLDNVVRGALAPLQVAARPIEVLQRGVRVARVPAGRLFVGYS